jgi:hypothetical protein
LILPQKEAIGMVRKRILRRDRVRRVPGRFSWVDHRLVRDEHICGRSHQSLALYLLLVTVSDAQGLSFYSDASLQRYLGLSPMLLEQARVGLCEAQLIAYSAPLYQVLSLETSSSTTSQVSSAPASKRGNSELTSVADVLREAIGGVR